MHPDAQKELEQLLQDVVDGKRPETDIPRLFYCGHKLVHSIEGPNTPHGWARWECTSCKQQWEAWDGTTCPSCKVVKN